MGANVRRHKYNVAPRAERTYKNVCYASKAEATRARELNMLMMMIPSQLEEYARQVPVKLGEDFTTIVDFVLYYFNGTVRYEEIKGFETKRFKQVRRLWKKHGPGPLHIMKWYGSGWKTEVLQGKVPE